MPISPQANHKNSTKTLKSSNSAQPCSSCHLPLSNQGIFLARLTKRALPEHTSPPHVPKHRCELCWVADCLLGTTQSSWVSSVLAHGNGTSSAPHDISGYETCLLTPVNCPCLTCWMGRMQKTWGCSLLSLFDRGICDADLALDGLMCSFTLLWLSHHLPLHFLAAFHSHWLVGLNLNQLTCTLPQVSVSLSLPCQLHSL